MSNFRGFVDLRTVAELAIGPAPPLSRTGAPASSKPGKLGKLGAVVNAASMTAGAFSAARDAIIRREQAVSFSVQLSNAASGFRDEADRMLGGGSIADAACQVADNAAAFDVSALVQFSGMKAGPLKNITASARTSLTKRLSQKQARIAAMAGQFAKIASAATAVGVIIQENRDRRANPQKDDIDRPSIPRLAMGGAAAQLDLVLKDKRKLLAIGIAVGSGAPSYWTRNVIDVADRLKSFRNMPTFHASLNMIFTDKKGGASGGGNWSEPPSPYAAQFPHNNVRQTESGHVEEWDDTPGAERVHIFHRSGSFVEMHPDGKVVYKSMSHGYQISMGDHNVKVKGDCNFSVDGNATIHSKGEVHLQGDEGINIQTKKDFNVYAQNINLRAKETARLDGTMIDLRYAKLPGAPVMTMQGPAVGLLMEKVKEDYPLVARGLTERADLRRANLDFDRATITGAYMKTMSTSEEFMSNGASAVGTAVLAAAAGTKSMSESYALGLGASEDALKKLANAVRILSGDDE